MIDIVEFIKETDPALYKELLVMEGTKMEGCKTYDSRRIKMIKQEIMELIKDDKEFQEIINEAIEEIKSDSASLFKQ